MAAFWRVRGRARVTWAIEAVTMLPFALPGTVLALAALAYWNERWALGLLPPIAGTVWLLPLALAIRILPLAYRATTASLTTLDPALEEAAASLGASPARRLLRVTLPAITPSLLAAALLGLLLASGELAASIMLYVPGNTPVSVKIDTLFRHSRFGEPFAYATLLIAFQIAVVLAAAWISGRRSGRRRKCA
jgi:iron(III) transport system permease protein